MGLMTKLAGEAIKRVAGGATKKLTEEQLKRENAKRAKGLVQYAINNNIRFFKVVSSLEESTRGLVEKISNSKNVKLSFSEKGALKKMKNDAKLNLQYLYLCKDYFVYLSKIDSDIVLEEKEYSFVVKFSPFFDGKKVLEIEEKDESLLGAFKEMSKEFTEVFISSNSEFCFEDFLSNYENEIENLIVPDVSSEIKAFENSVSSNGAIVSFGDSVIHNEIRCINCQAVVDAGNNFCPSCGSKVEIPSHKYCSGCGLKLDGNVKFCPQCGQKSEG